MKYRFIPEANARVAAVQSGDIDVVADIPPDLSKRLDGRADLTAVKIFPFCMQVYVLNTQQGLTKDPLVRQAINAVVNVDEIANLVTVSECDTLHWIYRNLLNHTFNELRRTVTRSVNMLEHHIDYLEVAG